MTQIRGFLAFVHHFAGADCTNQGASSRERGVQWVIVEHEDGDLHEVSEHAPAMRIDRNYNVGGRLHLSLEPINPVSAYDAPAADLCGPMNGGNWIEPTGKLAEILDGWGKIKIHDRYETWAQYHAMSAS